MVTWRFWGRFCGAGAIETFERCLGDHVQLFPDHAQLYPGEPRTVAKSTFFSKGGWKLVTLLAVETGKKIRRSYKSQI